MALSGKWKGRLKEERGSLWFRVLATKLGDECHFLHAEGERGGTI